MGWFNLFFLAEYRDILRRCGIYLKTYCIEETVGSLAASFKSKQECGNIATPSLTTKKS